MRLLEFFGLSKGLSKRRSWQELIGPRPHMIDETNADAGYGKRKTYDVVDRIAIVDVRGLLVNDEDEWESYGCSTYDRITEEIRGAVDDPAIEGILLRVNSPGGETDNAFETAAEIVSAGKQKPVWSAAETSAYSAGYLLASSGSRVYVPPYSGGVGSIGVYTVHMDFSGLLDQLGVKPTIISAGKGKTDGHPFQPLSASAKDRITKRIDKLYGMFVDHVAAQRNVTAGSIREMGAALKDGQDAIDSGLADRIGNTATALTDMRSYLDARATAVTLPGVATNSAASAAHEEVPMPPEGTAQETTPAAVETPAATAPAATAPGATAPVDDDPVVAAREAAARQDSIIALCATQGLSAQRAQELIASGQTVEQVQAALLEQRAAESDQSEIVSQLQPTTAAGTGTANVNDSPIVRAAEKLAQKGR